MKRVGWLLVGMLAVGGCALIAGIDGDYVEGSLGEGGTGLSANGGEAGVTSNSGGSPPGSGGNPTQGGGGTGAGPGNGGGGMGGAGGGPGGGGSGGGTTCPTGPHTINATVAACIDPTAPNTAACLAQGTQGGVPRLVISTDSDTDPYDAFARFNLASDVAQGPFTSATLRVVVGASANDGTVDNGDVYRVAPFDAVSLNTTAPANVGGVASPALDVNPSATVNYPLPTTGLVDGTSVYLALRGLSGDDYRILSDPNTVQLILVCP